MLTTNPFADIATVIPAFLMQYFVIAMVLLIIIGTGLDMLHKKNVIYFFKNADISFWGFWKVSDSFPGV